MHSKSAEINTNISVITMNVNGLNFPIKGQCFPNSAIKKMSYMLFMRDN